MKITLKDFLYLLVNASNKEYTVTYIDDDFHTLEVYTDTRANFVTDKKYRYLLRKTMLSLDVENNNFLVWDHN